MATKYAYAKIGGSVQLCEVVRPTTRGFDPYKYLPSFAKAAIERLDNDSAMRNAEMLNFLLDSYASGATVDDHTRASAHHICARRFGDTFTR